MLRQNHFLWTLGISPWIFYALNYDIIQIILLSFLTAFLSPFPDTDLKIVKYFKKLNLKTLYLTYPIYILIKLIFKHRTITHTLFIPITLLYLQHRFLENEILIALTISFSLALILHIFEDSLTIAGIKLFWPIPITLRLAKFKTSSKLHHNILLIIGFIFIISFPYYYFIY